MNWKSEERKAAYYNVATDPWDRDCLVLAESMGDWLEAGFEWRAFDLQCWQEEQIGYAVSILLSEWNSPNFYTEILSPIERLFVAPYVLAHIEALQTLAENQNHKGEADEQLSDLDK